MRNDYTSTFCFISEKNQLADIKWEEQDGIPPGYVYEIGNGWVTYAFFNTTDRRTKEIAEHLSARHQRPLIFGDHHEDFGLTLYCYENGQFVQQVSYLNERLKGTTEWLQQHASFDATQNEYKQFEQLRTTLLGEEFANHGMSYSDADYYKNEATVKELVSHEMGEPHLFLDVLQRHYDLATQYGYYVVAYKEWGIRKHQIDFYKMLDLSRFIEIEISLFSEFQNIQISGHGFVRIHRKVPYYNHNDYAEYILDDDYLHKLFKWIEEKLEEKEQIVYCSAEQAKAHIEREYHIITPENVSSFL